MKGIRTPTEWQTAVDLTAALIELRTAVVLPFVGYDVDRGRELIELARGRGYRPREDAVALIVSELADLADMAALPPALPGAGMRRSDPASPGPPR